MSQFFSKLDKVTTPIKHKIQTFLHNLKNEEKQSVVEANMSKVIGTINTQVWLWIHDEWIQYKNIFVSYELKKAGLLSSYKVFDGMVQSILRPMIRIISADYTFPDLIKEMVKRQVGYDIGFKSTEKKLRDSYVF